jgi:hypothetical protein
MSVKRGLSKQQRLYYEHKNKDKVLQELQEKVRETREYEETILVPLFDPHRISIYN